MKNLIFAAGLLFSSSSLIGQSTGLSINNTICYRIFVKATAIDQSTCTGAITSAGWIAINASSSGSIAPVGPTSYNWHQLLVYIDPYSGCPAENTNDATRTSPSVSCTGNPINISVPINCNKGCSNLTIGTIWNSSTAVTVYS